MKNNINRILQASNYNVQKVIAIEELSELQKEITKDLRGKGNKEHIAEEIADVYIMLSQLTMMYDIDNISINVIIDSKIERTMERLGIKNESRIIKISKR